MIHHLFLLVVLSSSPQWLLAQFNETIRTGRPGQAIGSFAVGHGIVQVQGGFDYYSTRRQSERTDGVLNNTVVRVGLIEPLEVSAMIEYRSERIANKDVRTQVRGLSAFDVGFRYHLLTGHGWLPNIGLQVRTRLPVLSEAYRIENIAPRFIVVASRKVSKKLFLITNLGAEWNGNNGRANGTYVFNLSFPFNETLGGYIETFGNIDGTSSTINLDSGIAWLVTRDLQLDVYGGYGGNENSQTLFVSVGVSFRTKKRIRNQE